MGSRLKAFAAGARTLGGTVGVATDAAAMACAAIRPWRLALCHAGSGIAGTAPGAGSAAPALAALGARADAPANPLHAGNTPPARLRRRRSRGRLAGPRRLGRRPARGTGRIELSRHAGFRPARRL